MNTSTFLAKLIGPYCLIVGLGVLFNLKFYQSMVEDLLNNRAAMYIAGIFALLFGLLIVQLHNIWVAGWLVIITVMGWLGVLKGVWIIGFPLTLSKLIAFYQKNPVYLRNKPP